MVHRHHHHAPPHLLQRKDGEGGVRRQLDGVQAAGEDAEAGQGVERGTAREVRARSAAAEECVVLERIDGGRWSGAQVGVN